MSDTLTTAVAKKKPQRSASAPDVLSDPLADNLGGGITRRKSDPGLLVTADASVQRFVERGIESEAARMANGIAPPPVDPAQQPTAPANGSAQQPSAPSNGTPQQPSTAVEAPTPPAPAKAEPEPEAPVLYEQAVSAAPPAQVIEEVRSDPNAAKWMDQNLPIEEKGSEPEPEPSLPATPQAPTVTPQKATTPAEPEADDDWDDGDPAVASLTTLEELRRFWLAAPKQFGGKPPPALQPQQPAVQPDQPVQPAQPAQPAQEAEPDVEPEPEVAARPPQVADEDDDDDFDNDDPDFEAEPEQVAPPQVAQPVAAVGNGAPPPDPNPPAPPVMVVPRRSVHERLAAKREAREKVQWKAKKPDAVAAAKKKVKKRIDEASTANVSGWNAAIGTYDTARKAEGATMAFTSPNGVETSSQWMSAQQGLVETGWTANFAEVAGDISGLVTVVDQIKQANAILGNPSAASPAELKWAIRTGNMAVAEGEKYAISLLKKSGEFVAQCGSWAGGQTGTVVATAAAAFAAPLTIALSAYSAARSIRKAAKAGARKRGLGKQKTAMQADQQNLQRDLGAEEYQMLLGATEYAKKKSGRKEARQGIAAAGSIVGVAAGVTALVVLLGVTAATPVGWVLAGLAATIGLGLGAWRLGRWLLKKSKARTQRNELRGELAASLATALTNGPADQNPFQETLGLSRDEAIHVFELDAADLQDRAKLQAKLDKGLRKKYRPEVLKKKEGIAENLLDALLEVETSPTAEGIVTRLGISQEIVDHFQLGGTPPERAKLKDLLLKKMESW